MYPLFHGVILLVFTFKLTFCDNTICTPLLSGLHYAQTDSSKIAVQKWLTDNYERLKAMQFVPTKKDEIQPRGFFTLSHLRKEAEDQRKQNYSKAHITNDLDWVLHKQLDQIEPMLNSNPKKAHNKFKKLFTEFKSPRAMFGMAVALNKLAMRTAKKSENLKDITKRELEDVKKKRTDEPTALQLNNESDLEQSTGKEKTLTDSQRVFKRAHERHHEANSLQGKAADRFCHVITMDDVPLYLLVTSGKACLELRRQRKEKEKLIKILTTLKDKFPNSIEYPSELGFEYLQRRQYRKAIEVYKQILERWSSRALKENLLLGVAMHLSKKYSKAEVDALFQTPLKTSMINDISKSFKHLSESYYQSGFKKEAEEINNIGAELGLFMSKWQKGMYDNKYYFPRLTAKPIWNLEDLENVGQSLKSLASNWQIIKKEALNALFGHHDNFHEEAANLRAEGLWQELVLYENGRKVEDGCNLAPKTCALLEKYINEEAVKCQRGQIKFSVLHPGTHIHPHIGPTNTRLRAHLGLKVPEEGLVEMRIADQRVRWSEGKVFVIDDSFEHEVWHQGNGIRVVLLIDFWHPDVSEAQRKLMPPLQVEEANIDRTTVFHISGIVSEITDGLSKYSTKNVITNPKSVYV